MERWDRTVLNINATCRSKMPSVAWHACPRIYMAKGRLVCLNTLLAQDFPGLADVLDTTHRDLVEATLYHQLPGTSMESAWFKLFTKKEKKTPKMMALPPTSANLLQHALQDHLQTILWKAADHRG